MPDALGASETERLLIGWIERHIGKVVRLEAEARWRPAWTADAIRDGRLIPLYIKGPREVQPMAPVKLEGAALDILHRNGIPVPRQYGYCLDIDAIVMERLDGESRLEAIADIAVRDRVADEYVQAMVGFHALDPSLFLEAGFAPPADPAQLRLAQFDRIEATYLAKKRIAEPANEFLRLWVRRNVPTGPIAPSFITGDAFQMMHHQGHLKAVMDLEMACIGDPLLDLACIRMRDLSEKTGDAAAITRRYAELSGKPLDMTALRFHLVAFSAVSSLLISDIIANPGEATDYFEYHVYYHGSLRIALEALAEVLEVTLEPLAEPQEVAGPDATHLEMLTLAVEQIEANTDMERYKRSKALAEIAFLQRRDRYGAAFDRAYLDDIAALTGRRSLDLAEAETLLEAFVHAAGPEADTALLRLLHAQELRHCFLADIPQNTRLRRFLREPIAPLT